MKEYEYIFNDIHSSFAASVVIYKESCYMLLNPLSLQDNQMKDLLEDRDENAWSGATLRKSLEKRPGSNSRVYLSLVDKLNRRILLHTKKLKLSPDLRVSLLWNFTYHLGNTDSISLRGLHWTTPLTRTPVKSSSVMYGGKSREASARLSASNSWRR